MGADYVPFSRVGTRRISRSLDQHGPANPGREDSNRAPPDKTRQQTLLSLALSLGVGCPGRDDTDVTHRSRLCRTAAGRERERETTAANWKPCLHARTYVRECMRVRPARSPPAGRVGRWPPPISSAIIAPRPRWQTVRGASQRCVNERETFPSVVCLRATTSKPASQPASQSVSDDDDDGRQWRPDKAASDHVPEAESVRGGARQAEREGDPEPGLADPTRRPSAWSGPSPSPSRACPTVRIQRAYQAGEPYVYVRVDRGSTYDTRAHCIRVE